MLDDYDSATQAEALTVLKDLLALCKRPQEPATAPKQVPARQHSPERELALGSVLTALRRASHVRLNDADQRLNECARDFILREIQGERALAHRSRGAS